MLPGFNMFCDQSGAARRAVGVTLVAEVAQTLEQREQHARGAPVQRGIRLVGDSGLMTLGEHPVECLAAEFPGGAFAAGGPHRCSEIPVSSPSSDRSAVNEPSSPALTTMPSALRLQSQP